MVWNSSLRGIIGRTKEITSHPHIQDNFLNGKAFGWCSRVYISVIHSVIACESVSQFCHARDRAKYNTSIPRVMLLTIPGKLQPISSIRLWKSGLFGLFGLQFYNHPLPTQVLYSRNYSICITLLFPTPIPMGWITVELFCYLESNHMFPTELYNAVDGKETHPQSLRYSKYAMSDRDFSLSKLHKYSFSTVRRRALREGANCSPRIYSLRPPCFLQEPQIMVTDPAQLIENPEVDRVLAFLFPSFASSR